MATGQLAFKPPEFDWHAEDQHEAFKHWKGQTIMALETSNIKEEKWYTTIIGFLGTEGYKWWTNLTISTQEENRKDLEKIFKAIEDT